MAKYKRAVRRVEFVVGDRDDFEAPAVVLHGEVRDDRSAERCLVLAAGDMGLDPISWLYL